MGLLDESKVTNGMALLRFVSGCIEVIAAGIMFRLGTVNNALKINAVLGLIGPLVMVLVSALGLVAIAVKVPPTRTIMVAAGVLIILFATR